MYQSVLVLVGAESDALYQNVYLKLNGINLDVNATPAPCAAGSDTVCPVRAGNFNRYSAVVNFASDLPPVRHIVFLIIQKTSVSHFNSQYENHAECAATH